jgi:hypothetical protein
MPIRRPFSCPTTPRGLYPNPPRLPSIVAASSPPQHGEAVPLVRLAISSSSYSCLTLPQAGKRSAGTWVAGKWELNNDQLKQLGKDLLRFKSLADVEGWLEQHTAVDG